MSKSHRPEKSNRTRRRGALAALLAAASLLSGVLALAPAPAVAATDQGDNCASLPEIWEQLACEEEHGGSGSGEAGTAEPTTADSTTANPGETASKPPAPVHTDEPLFDSDFDESKASRLDRLFGDTPLDRLSRAYSRCSRIWQKARQATHRKGRVLFWLVRDDPDNSEVQDELSERWQDNHCSQVFDLVGMP
jgi:hypothetical protein